jgi:zinc protease
LRAHLARLREGSRLLLVVVGDIDAAHVIAQARAAFDALPRGDYVETSLPKPHFSQASLVTEQRALPTNYLQGWFTIPAPGEPGYAAARVALNYMWDQLFKEVRTKRSLSYAVGTGVNLSQAGALGYISVSAVDPNTTYKVMLDELRRLQTTPMTPVDLAGSKNIFLTNFLAGSETTDGQAGLLADWQLRTGDWRQSRTFMNRVRAVTAADVQAFAKRDFVHLQTLMLGDPAKLDPVLAKSL